MPRLVLLAATLLALVGLVGCRSDSDSSAASHAVPGSGRAISVPSDEPTIQAAVDHALPGDLVLVSQGVYNEAVDVRTASIVIRGVDRNGVVLDGQGRLDHGIWLSAAGVAVENLTVRNYLGSGVVVSGGSGTGGSAGGAPTARGSVGAAPPTEGSSEGSSADSAAAAVEGYRLSYVTSYGNDRGGLRVVGARGGLIEHALAWGNGEAGIGIEACAPCRSVVTESEAARNSTGFSATNAGGDLFVVNSTFHDNRVGMSLTSEGDRERSLQGDTILAANLVTDNDDPDTPQTATGGFGLGIVVGGGRGNRIERNRVTGHDGVGIVLTDVHRTGPRDNTVRGNVVQANRTDVAVFLVTVSPTAAKGNCFADNDAATSAPPDVQRILVCGRAGVLPASLPPPVLPSAPTGLPPSAVAPPDDQPSMPNAATAPAIPADRLLPSIDVESLAVPAPRAG